MLAVPVRGREHVSTGKRLQLRGEMGGLYTYAWQKASKAFLAQPENALCRMHRQRGDTVAATIVDHIIPHRGDHALFWDRSNWQPLCKLCHDSHKQSEERTGRQRGCAIDGTPLDRSHHWNRGRLKV